MMNKTIKVVPNGVNTSQFKVMNRINRYIDNQVDLMAATDGRTAEKVERVLN